MTESNFDKQQHSMKIMQNFDAKGSFVIKLAKADSVSLDLFWCLPEKEALEEKSID